MANIQAPFSRAVLCDALVLAVGLEKATWVWFAVAAAPVLRACLFP